MSKQQKKNYFIPNLDYRIVLIFAIVFITALIIFLLRMRNSVDCEAVTLDVKSKNFLANENVMFNTNIEDAKEFEWDFGDGTPIVKIKNPTHKYIVPGKYFVRLSVNGSCYVEKEIIIKSINDIVLHETVPEIIAPEVVRVGDPVQFDYYFSDESKDVFSWEWSFGETGELDKLDENPTYVFQSPGQKRVSLIINGDVKYITAKNIFVKPRDPVVNTFAYRQRIQDEVKLNPGKPQKDPVDEYVANLPAAPSPIPVNKIAAAEKKMAPKISSEQFEIMLLKVAEQSMTKEDFNEYICQDYEMPVIKNQSKMMNFTEFCLAIKGKKIRIESLSLSKDPENNCIVSINVNYKVKKNLIWLRD